MAVLESLISFAISLLISAVIIYFSTKMFGEKEGFGTAILAAVIGAIIYAVAYSFFGGWLASIIGGLAWLIALGSLYGIGWLKSFVIALVIWILATIVSAVLPTVRGPL